MSKEEIQKAIKDYIKKNLYIDIRAASGYHQKDKRSITVTVYLSGEIITQDNTEY
jgi:hypothetical protein